MTPPDLAPLGSKPDPLTQVIHALGDLVDAAHEQDNDELAERVDPVLEGLRALHADGTLASDAEPWWEDRANLVALLGWMASHGMRIEVHALDFIQFPHKYQNVWDAMQAERLARVPF